MKVIWFTRIRYGRGRHFFSGDSGATLSIKLSCVIKYMKSTAEVLRVMALSTPASITHPIQTCLSDLDCLATVVYHCGMYRDGGVSDVVPTSGPKVNEVVAVCDLSLCEAGDAKPWPDLPPNLRLKCLTAPAILITRQVS